MRDALVLGGASIAGLICGWAVIVVTCGLPQMDLRRRALGFRAWSRDLLIVALARRLSDGIERAGWRETPERLATLGMAVSTCLAVAGAAVDPWLAPVGFVAGCGVSVLALSSAVERRRARLTGELVPLLELFTLELSAGGSAVAALGSVSLQIESELAADLRRMLIASQVNGSPSFESRLLDFSERLHIPALGTLATILGADREFGTGASQGVRALATDLRRAQRRDLIERSRKALNHVLLPAAIGVLLPFLGVLMFPAVSVLQRSLR